MRVSNFACNVTGSLLTLTLDSNLSAASVNAVTHCRRQRLGAKWTGNFNLSFLQTLAMASALAEEVMGSVFSFRR